MEVRLVIPGRPIPMHRPRAMRNKKTGQPVIGKGGFPIMYIPATTLAYQDLVCAVAFQHRRRILEIMEQDKYKRIRVGLFLSFPKKRTADCNNVEANIFDGLAKGLGWRAEQKRSSVSDKQFLSAGVDYEDRTGNPHGFAVVTITPYAQQPIPDEDFI